MLSVKCSEQRLAHKSLHGSFCILFYISINSNSFWLRLPWFLLFKTRRAWCQKWDCRRHLLPSKGAWCERTESW